MSLRKMALATMGLALSLGFGAAAQPVSGLYVGAGAGANWLVGAKGDVVGEDPANLIARSFGAPDAASVRNAAAAAQQGAAAAQAAVQQAAVQAATAQAAAQAAAANPLLTAEYRFLGAEQPRVGADLRLGGANGPVLLRRSFDSANLNHSALLGIRYAFNQPRPAPVAAAPAAAPASVPAPARTYLVFFDWDRTDLTDRARQIIAEAAQVTRRVQVTRIEVAGHADTSGTPRYNQGLSVRRAQNIAAELVRLGVPRQAITVQGFGENRPLVPTGDGVREPQNRRVEILLR